MVNVEAEKIKIEKVLKRERMPRTGRTWTRCSRRYQRNLILQKCGSPQDSGIDAWREDYEKFFKSGFISTSITCLGREVSASGDMAWEYGASFLSLKALMSLQVRREIPRRVDESRWQVEVGCG